MPRTRQSSWAGDAGRLLIYLLPAVLLLGASVKAQETQREILWTGTGIEVALTLILLAANRSFNPQVGVILILYLFALAWLHLSQSITDDWYSALAQFLLLVVPLVFFAAQTLIDSGAVASRRANLLADRLARRKDWPANLDDCRTLPEVKALREALDIDAAPALNLLKDARPQVRLAALAALEFHQDWKPGQPQLVLRFAQQCKEPVIRAAAILALANIEDRYLVESLAAFLRDPAPEVRHAAVEALLWDCSKRWGWLRDAIHQAMSDPALSGDGPLFADAAILSPDALADLHAWGNEKGIISVRAAQTLARSYQRIFASEHDPVLLQAIKEKVADVQASAPLRIELLQVLRSLGELDSDLQVRLLDLANPAPLRLLAAEELLQRGRDPNVVAVLRDIARMPNREMALATADVIQRRLGIDLGLPIGQPLPPLHSRQATDVMRRLMKWATTDPSSSESQPDGARRKADSGTFGLPRLR